MCIYEYRSCPQCYSRTRISSHLRRCASHQLWAQQRGVSADSDSPCAVSKKRCAKEPVDSEKRHENKTVESAICAVCLHMIDQAKQCQR